jgi:YVTN family beta-propeller protein
MKRGIGFLSLAALAAALAGVAGAQSYVEGTITVGLQPWAAVYDSINNKVFVANHGSNNVSVINPETNTVTATIDVSELPSAICWSPTSNAVYVACAPLSGNGSVVVINAATNEVVSSLDVGAEPIALSWSSISNKAYVVNRTSQVVTSIDCTNNQVAANIPLAGGQTPTEIVYNPTMNRVYIASGKMQENGRVRVIDCYADTLCGSISCGSNTWSIACSPTSNRIFAANRSSHTVTVINGVTNQRVGTITVASGSEPHGMLWAPDLNKLFIGEYWTGNVAFLSADSLRVRGRYSVVGNPNTHVYNPHTQKVFTAAYLSAALCGSDARDGHEWARETLQVGSGPLSMVYYPAQERIFVTNSWDSTVTVLKDVVGIAESGSPPSSPRGTPGVRAIPNPAGPAAQVRFAVQGFEPARLVVRDASGRLVQTADFRARNLHRWAPGVYFCTLSDGLHSADCKLVVR